MKNSPRDIKTVFTNIGKGLSQIHWSVWFTLALLAIFVPLTSLYFKEIQIPQDVYLVLHTILTFFQSAVILGVFCVIIFNREFQDIWVHIIAHLSLLFYVIVGFIQGVSVILSTNGDYQILYFDSDAWLTILSALVMLFLTLMFFLKEAKRRYKIFMGCIFSAIAIIILLDLTAIINVSFDYWMIIFLLILDTTVLIFFLFYQQKFKIRYPKAPFGLFLSFSILYQALMCLFLVYGITNGELFGHAFAILAHIAVLFSIFRTLVDYPYQMLKDTVSEQSRTFKNVTTLINHDVANQLAVAAGAIDLSLDTEQNVFLEKAASSVDYSLVLIRRLIKTGREISVSEKKCIDVYAETLTLIEEIKQSNDFPEKKISIICEKFDLKIYGYDILLRIISNMITNAIKHSSKQKVNIWIRFLDNRKTTKEYKLIIEDDGDGIPPKRKEKLLHKPVVSKEGFGMGLFLASNMMAEQFNGSITIKDRVENDYSKGAKFIISLPVQKKECRQMLKLLDK